MIALLLLLQQGAPVPTVGDTLWLSRRVAVPVGAAVRARDWTPSGDIELLGAGTVIAGDRTAEIRYPVVAWAPGPHRVEVPGPLILLPGGAIDTIPAESISIEVRSVLPDSARRDSALVPRPAATVVIPVRTDPGPLLVWTGGTLLIAIALILLRQRRRPPPAEAPEPVAELPGPAIGAWAMAGEARAACEIGALSLRMAIHRRFPPADPRLDSGAVLRLLEGSRPQWPIAEIRRVLGALDRVRFGAGGGGGDVGPLLEDVARLTREVEGLG